MTADDLSVQRRLERMSALVSTNRVDEAQREALTAVAEIPDSDELWAALATVENKRGDYAASVYAAERALGLNPHNARAMHALGPAYFHTGRPADARRIVDELVGIAPDSSAALLQRACVYSWTVATEADRVVVRENGSHALYLDPRNAESYGLVAEAHFLIGDAGPALRFLEDGLAINPLSETLLLAMARYGSVGERQKVEIARTVLASNPRNVHALRLLHFVTWRRLMRLAAVPSIVGALASSLAYSFFLHGGAEGARVWLGILLVPAALSWLWMFVALAMVGPPTRLAETLRRAPLGLLGFVVTAVANIALMAEIATLFVMPLRDAVALKGILDLLAVTVVALCFADVLMRIGAAQRGRGTGLFTDTPEGRISARYATRGAWDTNFGRLSAVAIVLFSTVAAVWMPGAFALIAIAAALVSTVLAKAGAHAAQRSTPRVAALWYACTVATVAAAVAATAAQLSG